MDTAQNAIKLYKLLADRARNVIGEIPSSHNTLFQPNLATITYYNKLYINQHFSGTLPVKRPGDDTCRYCNNFHLGSLKNINKDKDIGLGKQLEEVFQGFVQEQLTSTGNHVLKCERADTVNLHMPDFKIVRNIDGKIIQYFEFKAIFRPFLKIGVQNPGFECYSNSLTLDISNGKKLQIQRDLVEKELGLENVVYVYWYDLPCVKGVFWISAQRVYQIMDEQVPYARREVAGDYSQAGIKRGATKKIYLPLLEMEDLSSFIETIYNKSEEN